MITALFNQNSSENSELYVVWCQWPPRIKWPFDSSFHIKRVNRGSVPLVILNLASKAQKKTRQGQTLPQFQRKLRHIESAHRSASTFSGGLPAAQGQAHSHSGRPGPPQLHADTQGTPSWGWPHDRTLLRQGLSLWGIPHYPVSSGGKKIFPSLAIPLVRDKLILLLCLAVHMNLLRRFEVAAPATLLPSHPPRERAEWWVCSKRWGA